MSVNLGTSTKHMSHGDWFLPSQDELNAMYTNLHLEGVGDFLNSPGLYWSSTEVSNIFASIQRFSDGVQAGDDKGTVSTNTRACRSFTAGVSAYALRATGPAGGLIFYVDGAGTTYYEAAPADQSATQAWSNITGVEIGVTAQGTAIGTGQANTTAIINQAGHTSSAAKLCDDLSI